MLFNLSKIVLQYCRTVACLLTHQANNYDTDTMGFVGTMSFLSCLHLFITQCYHIAIATPGIYPLYNLERHSLTPFVMSLNATLQPGLISKPCQCVFGQGITSPQSHQNVWCKKSGNECQFKWVGSNIRTIPPQVTYTHENSK